MPVMPILWSRLLCSHHPAGPTTKPSPATACPGVIGSAACHSSDPAPESTAPGGPSRCLVSFHCRQRTYFVWLSPHIYGALFMIRDTGIIKCPARWRMCSSVVGWGAHLECQCQVLLLFWSSVIVLIIVICSLQYSGAMKASAQ